MTKICCAENGEENDPCGTDTGAVCSKKPCVNYEGPSSGGRDCEMGLWCCIQAAVKDREEAFKETEKAAPVCGDQEEEDGSDKGVCVKRECKKDAGETWLESNKKDCPGDDMFCCVPPAWIKIEEAEEAAEEAEEAVKAAQKELAECKDEKCKTKANAKLEKAQGDLKKAEAMGEAAEAGESIEDSQDAVDLAKTKVGSLAHIEKERLDAVEKKKKDDIAACENLEKKEKEACKTKANTDAAKAIAGIEAEKVAAQKKLGATKEELEAKEKCPGAPVNIQVLAAEVAKGSSKILKFQQEYNKVVEKCRTSEGVEKEIDEDGYWGPQTEKAKKALCEGKITCDEETQKTAKEERAAAPAAASTAAAAKAVKQAEASVAVAQQKTESKKQEVAKKESEVAAITAELEKLEAECGGGTTEEKPKKEEERAKEGEPCIGSVHGSKLTGTCLGSGLGITVSCAWGESVVAGTEDKCASGLRCCIKNGKVGDPCGSDEGAICTKVDSEGCKKFGGGSGGGSNCDGLGVQCCKP